MTAKMKLRFKGWGKVASLLVKTVREQRDIEVEEQKNPLENGKSRVRLNCGQRASLVALAKRLRKNGVLLADEVGMGKTRIAVEVARCVTECGGRVAILIPPGLGYQWRSELQDGGVIASRYFEVFGVTLRLGVTKTSRIKSRGSVKKWS